MEVYGRNFDGVKSVLVEQDSTASMMRHMKMPRQVFVLEVLDCLLQSDGVPFPRDVFLDGTFFASSRSRIPAQNDARQLGCVFQDMAPPKSILRKGTDMPKTIQRVKFTKAIARHTKIRDQNPSFGYICPGEPHERSPNAPKFEDRSQEETDWQEQGAREAAWKLAKNVLKSKEHQRAAFFSPSDNRCLPASTLKPEEREFVVDSGASMHMISKKDLSNAEMDTLTKSCSPTIVITANGEVQTHEEAIVYVKELYIFLTMESPR